MIDFVAGLRALSAAGVRFIVVGGAAATLIAVKRAAGRPKDFEAIAELEAILEESTAPPG
jgi:hypothetical protein